MAAIRLDRRTFLRGIGATAIALPMLEAMTDRRPAHADPKPIPKRFLVCFVGQSLGADFDPIHNMYVPDKIGADYDLKKALAPLSMYGNIKNEISVVSGLRIPTANGGAVPTGGRGDEFHIKSLCPLFSGVRSNPGEDYKVLGPSADQLVADAIAGDTVHKSLAYRVQAAWYLSGGSAPYGRDIMSYKLDSTGKLQAVPATVSPQAAFKSLFTGFKPPDPVDASNAEYQLKKRKSILDLVRGNTERLLPRLGNVDRARIQRHLDEIRDLERRIGAIVPAVEGSCKPLGDPGADPPSSGDNDPDIAKFDTMRGYSNEDARAKVFCDLVAMAFACDLTRAGSLMFTMAQSHMSAFPITGHAYDIHELGHSGGKDGTSKMSDAIAWHMKHFGYLVAKLRDTKEGTTSILDNTAVVLLHEGGHGYDPQGKKDLSSHCTDNMACLVAGRAGGLKAGQHIVAKDMHPGNVLNTAMKAVGVAKELGEVKGVVPGLLG